MELLQKPEHDFWRSRITLAIPQGSVAADVWETGSGLAQFFHDLADEWRGFEGLRNDRR